MGEGGSNFLDVCTAWLKAKKDMAYERMPVVTRCRGLYTRRANKAASQYGEREAMQMSVALTWQPKDQPNMDGTIYFLPSKDELIP